MTDIGPAVRQICAAHHNDASRLMDIVEAVQSRYGCISSEATNLIAQALGIPRVEVQSTVTFYSFLSERPKGRVIIRLCSDPIDEMFGMAPVAKTFEDALNFFRKKLTHLPQRRNNKLTGGKETPEGR